MGKKFFINYITFQKKGKKAVWEAIAVCLNTFIIILKMSKLQRTHGLTKARTGMAHLRRAEDATVAAAHEPNITQRQTIFYSVTMWCASHQPCLAPPKSSFIGSVWANYALNTFGKFGNRQKILEFFFCALLVFCASGWGTVSVEFEFRSLARFIECLLDLFIFFYRVYKFNEVTACFRDFFFNGLFTELSQSQLGRCSVGSDE